MGDFSLEIKRTDASLNETKVWMLQSGNILEASPCLGRELFTGQGLGRSDQMNYTCESDGCARAVDIPGNLQ
jgi:hypothetical protein